MWRYLWFFGKSKNISLNPRLLCFFAICLWYPELWSAQPDLQDHFLACPYWELLIYPWWKTSTVQVAKLDLHQLWHPQHLNSVWIGFIGKLLKMLFSCYLFSISLGVCNKKEEHLHHHLEAGCSTAYKRMNHVGVTFLQWMKHRCVSPFYQSYNYITWQRTDCHVGKGVSVLCNLATVFTDTVGNVTNSEWWPISICLFSFPQLPLTPPPTFN